MTATILQENIREDLITQAKAYKTAWTLLGQYLFTIWRDKTFYAWGYEKFEDYVIEELGFKKATAMKLVKLYCFTEQQEPQYLKETFTEHTDAIEVPSLEHLDVLRKAHRSDITKDDYQNIRKEVFEGKEPSLINKDLTAMIKERKQVDPQQEREERENKSIKTFIKSLRNFQHEAEVLNMVDDKIKKESDVLLDMLEDQYAWLF